MSDAAVVAHRAWRINFYDAKGEHMQKTVYHAAGMRDALGMALKAPYPANAGKCTIEFDPEAAPSPAERTANLMAPR